MPLFPLFLPIHYLIHLDVLYIIIFLMVFTFITISKQSSALVTKPEFANWKSLYFFHVPSSGHYPSFYKYIRPNYLCSCCFSSWMSLPFQYHLETVTLKSTIPGKYPAFDENRIQVCCHPECTHLSYHYLCCGIYLPVCLLGRPKVTQGEFIDGALLSVCF